MTENSFVNWATIVGGFAGLLSALYVVYEKAMSGAKVIVDVRSSKIKINTGESNYIVWLEIGNAGNELATLKKISMKCPMFDYVQSYDIEEAGAIGGHPLKFRIADMRTWVVEPGVSQVFKFNFGGNSPTTDMRTVPGVLKLVFLNHKDVEFPVTFNIEN